MKVEFNLTFEDYLDSQRYRLSYPPYWSESALHYVAILLAALGLGIYELAAEDRKPIGHALMVAAIAFFVFVIWRARSRKNRSQRTDVAALRIEYEQYFSRPCIFEAEVQGCSFVTPEGEHRHRWTDLAAVAQSERVLSLISLHRWHLIPKRALTTDELSTLLSLVGRGLRPGERICELDVNLTGLDWVSACGAHAWRRKKLSTLVWHMAVLVGTVLVYLYGRSGQGPGQFLYSWLAGLLGVAAVFFQPAKDLVLFAERDRRYTQYKVELRRDRVIQDAYQLQIISAIPYSRIHSVFETQRCFLLYASLASFWILPKRGMPSDALQAFRSALSEHISSGRLSLRAF